MGRINEDEIVGRLLPHPDGVFVDIGAGDGVTWSNSFHLAKRGWNGISIDPDPVKFAALATNYIELHNCELARMKATPETIQRLLHGVKQDFEFLSLDIDGYDLHLLRAILVTHKPKVICAEYNPTFPPGIKFSVRYHPDYWWSGGGFFGCSIEALVETLEPLGYGVESVVSDNVIFALDTSNDGWQKKWESGFLNYQDTVEVRSIMEIYKHHAVSISNMNQEDAHLTAMKFFDSHKGQYDVWR